MLQVHSTISTTRAFRYSLSAALLIGIYSWAATEVAVAATANAATDGADSGSGATHTCSQPATCPAPDNSKDPQITCYTPHAMPYLGKATLHVYGKYLANEDGPPRAIIWRDTETEGSAGRVQKEVTVVSDCHLKAEIDMRYTTAIVAGDKIEFRVHRMTQSQAQKSGARPDVGHRGILSGWRRLRVTK